MNLRRRSIVEQRQGIIPRAKEAGVERSAEFSLTHIPTEKRQALIIDKRAVMATEMCRALARRNFAVTVIGDSASPAFYSRCCAEKIVARSERIKDEYPRLVREILAAKRYDSIFICNEEILEVLLACPELLNHPGFVSSSHDSLHTALSKRAMLQVAASVGVAVPRTIAPANTTELLEAADQLGFPLIVKGDRGESGNHVRLIHEKPRLIDGYQEVAILEGCGDFGPVLQQYIRGDAYSVGGLYFQGKPLRVCAHRKLIGVPPLGGLTVRGITERPFGLLDTAFKVFEALNYTGLGHIELIRDSEGRFQFLEINPRAWGTIGVGDLAEVDFFSPYGALATGLIPAADLRFREGVRFHRFGRESKMLRAHPARLPGLIADCCNPKVRSDFTWSDPMPHFANFGHRLIQKILS